MIFPTTPTTPLSDAERAARLRAGLRFLTVSQATAAPVAGAWPADRHEWRRVRPDYTCFTTCLVSIGLATLAADPALLPAEQAHARHLMQRGAEFIHACRAAAPTGAYRFWPSHHCLTPGPDLDDTALAYVALSHAEVTHLDPLDALPLFAPYRVHRSTALHPLSHWAARHPGVFGVWMDEAPAIVDACVCANVVHCLARADARATPGYRASVRLLSAVLAGRQAAFEHSPYYRSAAAFAFSCALIPLPQAGRSPEEDAFAAALRAAVAAHVAQPVPTLHETLLWLNAAHCCGLPLPAETLHWAICQQRDDGSWPAGTICYDLHGLMYWTSAAVITTLALMLLGAANVPRRSAYDAPVRSIDNA